MDAAGHNRLVGHRLEADGVWEPPVVTSQESLLIIAVVVFVVLITVGVIVGVIVVIVAANANTNPPKGGGAAGLRSLPPSSDSLLRPLFSSALLPLPGTTMTNSPLSFLIRLVSLTYNSYTESTRLGDRSP